MKKNLHLAGLLTLAFIIIFASGFLVARLIFPLLHDDSVYLAIGVAALLLIGAGFTLNNFIQAYIMGARRLTEETRVIISANPAHRVQIETPSDIKKLGDTINTFADRFQAALADQSEQIQQAKVELEDEKNRLAALMSELTEGVLVCNLEGRILLYNSRAKQLLRHTPTSAGGNWSGQTSGFVGLGRSVFALIDRNALTYVLEDLQERHKKKSKNLVSQVVTTALNGQLILTRTAPIISHEDDINGFVITLADVTQQSDRSRRRDMLLQALTEGVRASLANIRTAIETIEQYPQMDSEKLGQMQKIIYDESLTLSSRLNQISTDYDNYFKADWQFEDMMGSDLLWAIQRQFEDKLNVTTQIMKQDETLWLKVDSFALVQALSILVQRLNTRCNVKSVQLNLTRTGQLAAFDMAWEDGVVDLDTLWSWQNELTDGDGDSKSLSLRDVAERHGGEVWVQSNKENKNINLRLLLPTTQPKTALHIQNVQASRPEYYDFDLFHQSALNPELDRCPLTDLTYTVFDTETTGLNPEVDEIISVSAVRIVNNRLLRQEVFDQLVDPKRPLPATATEITGISQEMVNGQPTIEQVLAPFHKFTEGTVLIAHNAAFDMRMLQVKETQTGIKFTNPVLDTLLLSAVTHANHKDHNLDAIAHRLGVNVIGRHTSLGDAILTGEIFLKLIPLLAEQGIYTLADALKAAEKSYMARIKY
ncbi:MAG: DNA polymerase III subunit epsilon [Chloroflexi bacterium]|nr:MAG: DNA polymerase III subunit epsilon [Chloroflexota bacterium]